MAKRLNIGFFIDTFFPMIDGVVMVVDNYCRILSKKHNVTVFTLEPAKSGYSDDYPYNVIRCKSIKTPFMDYDIPTPIFDIEFMNLLEDADLDIVHIHSPFMLGQLGLEYAKKHKIPSVATMHSQFRQDFKRSCKSDLVSDMLLREVMHIFNSADECWAVNKAIGDVFIEYGYNGEPLVYGNGTDMGLIEDPESSNRTVNEEYGLKEDDNLFVFVGRITVLKNVLFIADALSIVKAKGYRFRMLYIGSGSDEQLLREKITKLGLENEITLCGRIEDRSKISMIYRRAKLMLFPSMYDASSLVQIEAASQKTPTVFLEGSVTSSTVEDGYTGYISAPNPEAFAEKIISILNFEDKYDEVCENAYKNIYIKWDTLVSEIEKRYCELIEIKKIKNKKDKGIRLLLNR